MSNPTSSIPIFLPPDICKQEMDNLQCFDKLSTINCENIKESLDKLINDKEPAVINSFKQQIKTSNITDFLKNTSEKINNVFDNMTCVINNINSNKQLGLTEDEKIKPTDETALKYNFIVDIIDNNKDLKTKLFDNLGGKNLKIINMITIIFFVVSIIILSYLLLKK